MINSVVISKEELLKYGKVGNLSEQAGSLLLHQKENWELVKDNFNALNKVITKRYDFEDYYIKTQFNPSRIVSSSAKVDKKSIADRACFLCKKNLPKEQKGINYKDKYAILINPYPIFNQHLTIPHNVHIPQNIENSFSDMLALAYDLRDKFFVFYNGPKCGASAPDHLHFQAGLKNSTPLEEYFNSLIQNGTTILENESINIVVSNSRIFNLIYINSNTSGEIESFFNKILNVLKTFQNSDEEPLLNVISLYKDNSWHLFIIPRKKHRPDQFFLEGESKILISPASVDLAGLLITPRKEDFEKLTKSEIENIYDQVLFEDDLIEILKLIF